MDSTRDVLGKSCGCKGIRTCLLCEGEKAAGNSSQEKVKRLVRYMYCHRCQRAWRHKEGSLDQTQEMDFPGVLVVEDFITPEEEADIVAVIEGTEWKMSQSGRKKQDFGPKVNFKKKKIKLGGFTGLPNFSAALLDRMKSHDLLRDFTPVEQCHLEYDPCRGSAIDPHFDDFWLWGERLVTVNLLADAVLSMSCEENDVAVLTTLQNGKCEHSKPSESVAKTLSSLGSEISISSCQTSEEVHPQDRTRSPLRHSDVEVAILMPRRSLLVLYGDARHKWMHAIHREDIVGRRIAVTLRELSSEFGTEGLQNQAGKELIDIALSFNGSAI